MNRGLARPSGRIWLPLLAVVFVGLAGCDASSSATGPSRAVGILDSGTAGRWPTSSPESVGLSADVLTDLEQRVLRGEFEAVSSLLVLRRGALVYEWYADGWGADELHRVYSVTKSVTSLLVGMAREDGAIGGLDVPIVSFFPQYESFSNPSPEKSEISLEHVLQMRAGFEWDELSTNYAEGVNPTVLLAVSPDWVKFVLDLPLAASPGTQFVYNSGVSMLLAAALATANGVPADEYAQARLFAPLGITEWRWSRGPDDLTNGGWGLRLLPRDMAAIGQLVLEQGRWEGSQVVPEAWIEASSEASTRFVDGGGYGYQWWLGSDAGPAGSPSWVAAWGWGGQFVVVVPALDMVVVSTAENYASGGFDPAALAEFAYRAAGA